MTALARHLAQLTERRTAHPREHYERMLTCTRCGALIAVFEASNSGPHQHLNASTFRCNGCLKERSE